MLGNGHKYCNEPHHDIKPHLKYKNCFKTKMDAA